MGRRRAETTVVRAALIEEGLDVVDMQAPCACDGGDCMFTGKSLFVGLSVRVFV